MAGSEPNQPFSHSATPGTPELAMTSEGLGPNDIPPPPSPEASPEDKDRYWRKYVYQGDKMPQLTWRAVIMGGFLGMVMSASNLYTSLSIGWLFGVSITACVMSFIIWNFVRLCSGNRLSQMSMLENACMASTASAAGYATGSTVATMFGAMVLLTDPLPGQTLADVKTWEVTAPWVAVVFTLCTGLLGVFIAIPMKRQMVNHEQLAFPTGTAAAETLKSLYSRSAEAVQKAYVLLGGLVVGLVVGFLRVGDDVLEKVGWLRAFVGRISFLRIPAELEMHFISRLYPGGRFPNGFAFEPSVLLIAAGMLVGMRTSISLVLSSLLLYAVVAPQLAAVDAAHMERGAVAVYAAVDLLPQQSDPIAASEAVALATASVAASLDIDPRVLEEEARSATRRVVVANEQDRARRASAEVIAAAESAVVSASSMAHTAPVRAAAEKARDAALQSSFGNADPTTVTDTVVRAVATAAADAAESTLGAAGGGPAGVRAIIESRVEPALAAVALSEDERRTLAAAVVAAGRRNAGDIAAANYANRGAFLAAREARSKAISAGRTPDEADLYAAAAFNSERYIPNFIWNWGGGRLSITRWSLWGGTAVMVFSSLMSVALQWRTIARAFVGVKKGAVSGEDSAIEVPGSWMVIGMIPITIAMVWIQMVAFDVSWYAGIIAVAMSFVLSLVACRATGETDTTPIGAMGKVMQLTFAVLAPKNIWANLASAGIAANSASASADLLTDLKMGYLLGANPRRQFLAQFFGVFFGTVAIIPIWYLMVPNREALEKFALPSTRIWEAVAKVLVNGINELPPSAVYSILVGAIVGMALPVIEKVLPPKARKFMPSAMGLGLAWIMPFQNALSFFVGACVAFLWGKMGRQSADRYNVPIASGFIAGESLMAAALAIAATVAGLLATG